MRTTTLLSIAALISAVAAQTPAGYTPGSTNNLNVTFAPSVRVTPGIVLPKNVTTTAPAVILPGANSSLVYTIFMIDLDVPSNTSATGRTALLHWWQPNAVVSSNGTLAPASSPATSLVGAPYIGPNPPAGSGPHRYVLTVFTQPRNWSIPAQYNTINPPANNTLRVGFNITAFVNATGLSAPLAGNYFVVENTTATTTTSATPTPSVYKGTANANAPVTTAVGSLLGLLIFAFVGF